MQVVCMQNLFPCLFHSCDTWFMLCLLCFQSSFDWRYVADGRNRPNIYKWKNNWMYCYSCGYNVDHESPGCPAWCRKAQHQDGCNCGNVDAYEAVGHRPLRAGKHKTILPGNNVGYWQFGAVEGVRNDNFNKFGNFYHTLLDSTPHYNQNAITMEDTARGMELEYNDDDRYVIIIIL